MRSNSHRLVRIGRLGATLAKHQLTGNQRQFSTALFDAIFGLGGVYVKFLQVLIMRSDIFTDQSLAQQIRVYEDVTTEPIDLAATLQAELGQAGRARIASFDSQPFAAGSFGQVYHATLDDGQNVIIKVLRPSLTRTLAFDLRLLGFVARIIGLIRPNSMVDLRELYRDFKDVTVSEINYRAEAAFASELHGRYQNHPVILVPKTYLELCTKQIIVQDYVGGLSLAEVIAKSSADSVAYVREQLGSDLDYQLEELGVEFLRSVFAHPTVQGDPHPGNIKLLPGNRVGLIDFGMIVESPKDRTSLLALLKEYSKIYNGTIDIQGYSLALLGMFSGKLVSSIEVFGQASRNAYRAQSLLNEMANSAELIFHSSKQAEVERLLESGHFLLAFSQVINEGNRFGLKLQFEATNFLRSSNMFVHLVNGLGRREVVLQRVYSRAVADIGSSHYENLNAKQATMRPEQATEVLYDWLDRVAANDPLLFGRLQTHMQGIGHV